MVPGNELHRFVPLALRRFFLPYTFFHLPDTRNAHLSTRTPQHLTRNPQLPRPPPLGPALEPPADEFGKTTHDHVGKHDQHTHGGSRSGIAGIIHREQEILRLLAEGLPTREIAEKLFISPKTVDNHRANIMNKLDLHSTLELVRYAAKLGLIDMDLWTN
jgi:DNA-binding CsgD family transcriptional regulator